MEKRVGMVVPTLFWTTDLERPRGIVPPPQSRHHGRQEEEARSAPACARESGTWQGKKRTPQSAFDPAAGNDVYEPEKVVAQRMAKGGH
jgi:hypothetical protein